MNNNFTLNEDDLKVLKLLQKFIKSYGYSSASIELSVDALNIKPEEYLKEISNFSNHWDMEIPEFFQPLLQRLVNFAYLNQANPPEDVNINYNTIEIRINNDSINIEQTISYEDDGETRGLTWDLQDDPNDETLIEIFNELNELGLSSEDDIRLSFDGSGDSGYIEDTFDSSVVRAPAVIENWCYSELERNFGGWEINEGSWGYFVFDIKNKVIDLEYNERTERQEYEELLELNF